MASKVSGLDTEESSSVQASETAPGIEKYVEKIIFETLLHYLQGYLIRVFAFKDGDQLVLRGVTGSVGLKRRLEMIIMPEDIMEENLVYSAIPKQNYTLYVSTKGDKVRFLYSWLSRKTGKRFITVPYHNSQTKEESPVLCTKPNNISMSLKDKHPVRAIEAVLDELKVGKDPATDGFRSSGYLWFTEGTQGTFRVSNSESDYIGEIIRMG